MTTTPEQHRRYNATSKGAARYERYAGSVKGLERRMADVHRKRIRRTDASRAKAQV